MDSKVRDRTKEELTVRKNEFLEICRILDILDINYFLTSGVLLGAIRDNDFIKWDWDIELSVFADDFYPNIDLISNKLKESNFKIDKIIRNKDNLKIDFIGSYPKNVTAYTIYAYQYSKIRDVYWRKELTIPSKYLNKLSKLNFLGRQFNCPLYINDYLEFVYGDWKKPLRTSNKKVYLTKNYKKRTLFFTIYIEKFLMKIYGYSLMIKKLMKL
jgi:phosphorylcholine metabolism protein LicD